MATDPLSLGQNLDYVESLYARYLEDPQNVEPSWRALFSNGLGSPVAETRPLRPSASPNASVGVHTGPDTPVYQQAYRLVTAYRVRGHLEANLDPLGQWARAPHSELDPKNYGFTDEDMQRPTQAGVLYGLSESTLGEVHRRLRETYCGSIGVEMMHISRPERRAWLQECMEPSLNRPVGLTNETRLAIYDGLVAAETFERFVGTKYVGTKRFSLEGGETLIPLVELVLEHAGARGVEDIVIGMAHRGRLNVLANVMRKTAAEIFSEFEDLDPESTLGGGDVKYHLGYSIDRKTRQGNALHLSLAFNPSHLEAVDPVVVGRVRAKQRRRNDSRHAKVMGILIHGDAAFAGQGLVAETLNLADLRGFRTGGTVHIIVNNQIGFTTSPSDSRSTPYPTDVAKMTEVPIFHVNGDDPDAVAHVVELAMDYRATFQSDVVIDLFCFRRYGHNEADDPSFTQPLLYQAIERHAPVREIYGKRLVDEGVFTADDAMARVRAREEMLEGELALAKKSVKRPNVEMLGGVWKGFLGGPDASVPEVDTGVSRERIAEIGDRITQLPEGFRAHPKILRLYAARQQMAKGDQPIDWAMAEAIAFGSLLWDGTLVRFSGQDTRRGTFSHRHAVAVDVRTGAEHTPLGHLHEGQGEFRIYDSMLSEIAVMGFELGYSLDYPDGLVLWEAQFGDFVNGAQVILDQFISSSEDKWKRLCGLVLLLPHGFEGQGPEHSSARFERFLQLCAEDNMQVCYPSTPAQYFHMLRRQVLRKWRKPLIVMAPKSGLRLPACRSSIEEFTQGRFQRILLDPQISDNAAVNRVLVCAGKVYYDLADEQQKKKDSATAIVRLEQLYPLSDAEIIRAVEAYPKAKELVYVQEEPANMGARRFMMPRFRRLFPKLAIRSVTRAESASPATGSYKAHNIEQNHLVSTAFGPFDKLNR